MDRLSTGIMIALAAVLMSSGLLGDAMAGELGAKAPQTAATAQSPNPVANGLRSELVLGLVLTLEALRTAPVLLDTRKV